MRRHRSQPQAVLPREPYDVAPQHLYFGLSFLDGFANAGADLDDGLMHLRLHALLEDELALLEDLRLNMRLQIPCLRIDGLIFLFNPNAESRFHEISGKATVARALLPATRKSTLKSITTEARIPIRS